jgi:hypothetical protein
MGKLNPEGKTMTKESDRYGVELSLNLSAKQLITRLVMPGGVALVVRIIIYILERLVEINEAKDLEK